MADLIQPLSSQKGDVDKLFRAIDVYFEVVDEILAESKAANEAGRSDEAQRLLETAKKLLRNIKETNEIIKRLAGLST